MTRPKITRCQKCDELIIPSEDPHICWSFTVVLEHELEYLEGWDPTKANPFAALRQADLAEVEWVELYALTAEKAAEMAVAKWISEDRDALANGSYTTYVRDEMGHFFRCPVRTGQAITYCCPEAKAVSVRP